MAKDWSWADRALAQKKRYRRPLEAASRVHDQVQMCPGVPKLGTLG